GSQRGLLPSVRHGHPVRACALLLVPGGAGQRQDGYDDLGGRPRGVGGNRPGDRARPSGSSDEGRPLLTGPVRGHRWRRPRVQGSALLPQSAAASRLSTSHASPTSSSVVRKFPTASRSWYRSAKRVWERNTSPESLTRSSRRSFSSSVPARRKHTSEKCLGAV